MSAGAREAADQDARDPVGAAAKRLLGIDYLYPVQRFVISNVLEGNGQIVVLPTGAGKSLCFQLPAAFLDGPTLVLMPLLSLLSDQARKLAGSGIPTRSLRGGLSAEEKACLVPSTLRALRGCAVRHLVVDEAHCISEWGDTFRPAYHSLGEIARGLGRPVISAFTATASEAVIGAIKSALFGQADVRVVAGNADRPNISYAVLPVLSRGFAFTHLAGTTRKPLLVFCGTRNRVEMAARTIMRRRPGAPVRFYHAGLDREERAEVERWFLTSTDGTLIATCAYGMGVDKPDIRTVVHADVPPSVEAYLQESGRAGRDGMPSLALLLASAGDNSFHGRSPDPVARQRFLSMLSYARGAACRRNALLALIGQAPVACSGCDVCAGEAGRPAPGEEEITGFVQRHPRRFDAARAASILCAEPGPRARRGFLDTIPGWGALPGWTREDAEEAIRSLEYTGRLAERSHRPWKGKLISQIVASRAFM